MRIYSDRKEAIGLNKIIVEMSPEMYTQEEFEAFVSVLQWFLEANYARQKLWQDSVKACEGDCRCHEGDVH